MRYIVDTHIFLWSLNGDKRLKPAIKDVLQDTKNRIYVSVITALEMSIKSKTEKLKLKTTIKRSFELADFPVIDFTLDHALEVSKLPLHHRDPFDRVLIAQAKVENMPLITADKNIWKYKTGIIKA